MSAISQEDKDSAVYVLPAGYSESEFEMSEDEIAFNAFKEEAQDNENYSKITVSRVPMNRHGQRGSQKLHFLFECAVDEYSYSQLLSKLRDEYKSGFYKIQARNEKGQLKLNKTVAVEAPQLDTDTASGEGGTGAIIEQFSRSLTEQSAEMRDMMQSMMPSTNPMGSMKDMFETMGAMMGAMGLNRQEPKTLVEQLTEFKMIKELFGGDDNSEPGGEANLYSLLGKTVEAFGGPIAQAIAAGAQSGELSEAGLVALPAPKLDTRIEPTEAEQMATSRTVQEQHNMAMRKNIHILIQNAKAEIPPESFAMVLVNNTPEDKADELWDFISAENCVDTILALEPAAEPFKQWFVDLRIAVIELMSEPELAPTPEDLAGDKMASIAQDKEAEKEPEGEIILPGNSETLEIDTENMSIDTTGQQLQPGDDENTIIGSETTVAGMDSEAPASADQSDSDTPSDT